MGDRGPRLNSHGLQSCDALVNARLSNVLVVARRRRRILSWQSAGRGAVSSFLTKFRRLPRRQRRRMCRAHCQHQANQNRGSRSLSHEWRCSSRFSRVAVREVVTLRARITSPKGRRAIKAIHGSKLAALGLTALSIPRSVSKLIPSKRRLRPHEVIFCLGCLPLSWGPLAIHWPDKILAL